MKRFLLFGVFALCSVFVACNTTVNGEEPAEEPAVVDKVTLDPASVEILIGQTVQLSLVIEPADAECYVTWSSSNKDVATVNANGEVTGVASGAAMILVMAGDKSATCMVNVVGVPVESVVLSETSIEMDEGYTWTLSATVLPENADNKIVTWTSSDESVLTVNSAGTIKAIRGGEAVVTAMAGNKTAECHVTVNTVPLAAGYIYYSDGTWSRDYDPGKEAIGIVFYVGNPLEEDPALAREHPECTHGLAAALKKSGGVSWQVDFLNAPNVPALWIEESMLVYTTNFSGEGIDEPVNKIIGYNNTKALEEYNAAPENAGWPVNAVEYVVDFRDEEPAPEGTSDWYLPSAKELSFLSCGEYDGIVWASTGDIPGSVNQLKKLNEVIATIPGADQFGIIAGAPTFYWTSTEVTGPAEYSGPTTPLVLISVTGQVMSIDSKEAGYDPQTGFTAEIFQVRPVLAF